MAKLLPNRISEVMSEAQIKQFIEGIKTAKAALPKKIPLSNEEYDKIPKKGTAREKEADAMIKIVRAFPKFLPSVLSIEDVEKDNMLYDQVNALYDDHLQPLVDLADFIMGLSGGEEMNAYGRYIDNVRSAAKDGDLEAIEAANHLNDIERLRNNSQPKKPTTDAPPK